MERYRNPRSSSPKSGLFLNQVNAKMGKVKFKICRGLVFRGRLEIKIQEPS